MAQISGERSEPERQRFEKTGAKPGERAAFDGAHQVFDCKKLKRQRELMKMSREEVAKRAACMDEAYRLWEDGKEVPNDFWLNRLTIALGCETAALVKRWRRTKDA